MSDVLPDGLREIVQPLLPPAPKTGRPRADQRAVLTTVLFVQASGCSWEKTDGLFGVTRAIAHRWFKTWTETGLWPTIHRTVLDELGKRALLDWSRASVDSQSICAKGGEHTETNPTDRGKSGSKLHLLCVNQGLPLTCAISAANVNDIEVLQPLVRVIPAVRSRRGPRRRRPTKLHGDKAYHSREQRRWLRERGIGVRLPRPGIESSQRLGRHRYKVELSIAWLGSYRRLNVRWERKASTFLAMLGIACALIRYKHLAKHADGF
ncbi:IS5 family transposase [Nocardiopsis dassonvillei]|uniref:IS5 family transposase n=1 Tax=Nocardiopsis dassonvillei TaxID=2014 RepID=UPI00366B10B6